MSNLYTIWHYSEEHKRFFGPRTFFIGLYSTQEEAFSAYGSYLIKKHPDLWKYIVKNLKKYTRKKVKDFISLIKVINNSDESIRSIFYDNIHYELIKIDPGVPFDIPSWDHNTIDPINIDNLNWFIKNRKTGNFWN